MRLDATSPKPISVIPAAPLTNPAAISAYLASHDIAHTSVTPLSGGFSNFVFLVICDESNSFILKHTSTIIKAFPSMTAPVSRADAEVRALQTVPAAISVVSSNSTTHEYVPLDYLNVRLPVLLSYDDVAIVQCQAVAGIRTLKDAYGDIKLDIRSLGQRLGSWLARLHALRPVPADFGDNLVAKKIYGACYRGAPRVLFQRGLLGGEYVLEADSGAKTTAKVKESIKQHAFTGAHDFRALCANNMPHC
jgi:hypothetical protein